MSYGDEDDFKRTKDFRVEQSAFVVAGYTLPMALQDQIKEWTDELNQTVVVNSRMGVELEILNFETAKEDKFYDVRVTVHLVRL